MLPSVCATANFVESGEKANPLTAYDEVFSISFMQAARTPLQGVPSAIFSSFFSSFFLAYFVKNLSFLFPSLVSYSHIIRLPVATATFLASGDQARAVILSSGLKGSRQQCRQDFMYCSAIFALLKIRNCVFILEASETKQQRAF